jgi:hypothetical protein
MHLPRFALTRRHAALAVLAALAFGVMAAARPLLDSKCEAYKFARWQERQIAWFQGDGFATLTPRAHYDWALRLLHPRTEKIFRLGKDTISGPWIDTPSTDALKNAIRHLEAIPAESDVYLRAEALLPLVRLKRDRPQDFPAVEEARYRGCMAKAHASATSICGTGLDEECAPLAGSERLAELRALVQDRL